MSEAKSVFSVTTCEQVDFVIGEIQDRGYGIALGWMHPNRTRVIRDELTGTFSTGVSYRQFEFKDAILLPEQTAVVVTALGALARKKGLEPSQIGIITQSPREIGPGHFDDNASLSLVLPMTLSQAHVQRPNIDGIPLMQDDGTHVMYDSHGLTIPAGTLMGFAGSRDSQHAAYHRVGNPTDSDRYSIAIACV